MRQHCDCDTSGESPNAWRQDAPTAAGAEQRIDLDRVVWDPEYRDQVLEDMRTMG